LAIIPGSGRISQPDFFGTGKTPADRELKNGWMLSDNFRWDKTG
jgi:hypothetical protein